MRRLRAVLAVLLSLIAAVPAVAGPVGERIVEYARPGAALRDAQGRDSQRVTIWYPAADGAVETPRTIGPADRPFFISGQAADDAAPAAFAAAPVVAISHGFGGSARQTAWLGVALARAGYVVIAPDHPGNNGFDDRTPTGAVLWWERADDLRLALDAVLADPAWAGRLDPERIGVVGYSMGGASALLGLGARPDPARLATLCAADPRDSLCVDTIRDGDFGTASRAETLASSPAVVASAAGQGADRTDARIDAALLIAPGLVPVFAPDSLAAIDAPVLILHGAQDRVVPPDASQTLAQALPNETLTILPDVGHNDFLGLCGAAARLRYAPLCLGDGGRPGTHVAAAAAAIAFFDRTLKTTP